MHAGRRKRKWQELETTQKEFALRNVSQIFSCGESEWLHQLQRSYTDFPMMEDLPHL